MDAANIVDVVSDFVTLRKAGTNYKGLCPFHNERTPSFSVSPTKNYCHCFSCGKGGSPVGFIMEHEQMTYPEALRWLAKKYHIEVKEKELSNEEKQAESERESLFIVNEWAAQYYHDILHNNPDGTAIGMQYFRSRGFRDDIIEKFKLGFALDNRQEMPREAISKGYKAEFLIKTGLCYQRGEGPVVQDASALIDRFAGRAIFPWIGLNGKVVAFGGRKLDRATKGVQQKYVNSPESVIYHKDHELYGIFQAKKAIAKEDCVFMVEGYTDVISMHQSGLENVVANSGTALSIHQIHMLHRLTKNIVLLYDGDAAGIKAAMRGTDMLLSEGMNIKVLILPDGDDPDSFARKHTADEYKEYINTHQTDFIQFKTDMLLKGVTDPIKRSEAISSIIKSVSVIPDPIIRATYLQECSMRLRMNEQVLMNQMNNFIRDERKQQQRQKEREEKNNSDTPATLPSTPVLSGTPGQSPTPPPDYEYDPYDFEPKTAQQLEEERQAAQRGSAAAQQQRANAAVPSSQPQAKHPAMDDVESLLLQVIVRHGEEILYENIEAEDGSIISITVAQYIDYNLAEDNLKFSDPLYQHILEEAVQHSGEPDFHAAPFFSQHPDFEISKIGTDMLIDRYVLSKSLEYNPSIEAMQHRINRLMLDFRKKFVDHRVKELLAQIAAAKGDDVTALMEEYQKMQKIRSILAKQLGATMA